MEITQKEVRGKMRTVATFKSNYQGEEQEFEIMKLKFGELNVLKNKCMKVYFDDTGSKVEINSQTMNEQCLMMSLVKAPFTISLENIQDMEDPEAQAILRVYKELHSPADKKKQTLSGHSDTAQSIQK